MGSIGVIIPCFNAGPYIREAITSLEASHTQADEILIVDDGSTDIQTRQELLRAERRGCRVLHQDNMGPSAARNHGISRMTSDYVYPLDADDRIAPETLGIARETLDMQADARIVAGAVREFGLRDRVIPCPYDGVQSMLDGSVIYNSSAFRRTEWEAVGGYPEDIRYGEDWAFWMRILSLGGEVAVREEVFYEYRISGKQATAMSSPLKTAEAKNFVIRDSWAIYARYPDYLRDELCRQRLMAAHFRQRYGRLEALKVVLVDSPTWKNVQGFLSARRITRTQIPNEGSGGRQ